MSESTPNPPSPADRLAAAWAADESPQLLAYLDDSCGPDDFIALVRADVLARHQRALPWGVEHYRTLLGAEVVCPDKPVGELLVALLLALETIDPPELCDRLGTDWQALVDRLTQRADDMIDDDASTLVEQQADPDDGDSPTRKTGGKPRPSSAMSRVGESVGGYKLQQFLGRGGFGEVYAARSEKTRRIAAVKLIRRDTITRKTLQRFEVESEAMKRLGHPNVARIYNAGKTDSGEPYLAMEFIEGVPLHEYCDNRHLSIRDRLDLFIQVCHGVQHIHDNGLIHRDLSPDNILVTEHKHEDGRTYPVPKIIDLGVVSAITDDASLTAGVSQNIDFGKLVGKFTYMSPEMAEGGRIRPDIRTDVFSLGVILYELLTGVQPMGQHTLKGRALHEIVESVARTERPSPSVAYCRLDPDTADQIRQARGIPSEKDLVRRLNGRLRHLPMTALRLDRNKRYTSVSAMADDIENFLSDRDYEQAADEARLDRLLRHTRRNKLLYAAGLAVAMSLVGGIIATSIGMRIATKRANISSSNEINAIHERQIAVDESRKREAALAGGIPEVQRVASGQGASASKESEERARQEQQTQMQQIASQPNPSGLSSPTARLDSDDIVDELIGYLDEVLRMRRLVLGSDHARTIQAASRLGEVYWSEGMAQQAELLLEDALAARRSAQGEDHPETLKAIFGLATLYEEQGELAKAERLFLEELEGCRRVYRNDNDETLVSIQNLAQFYEDQQRMPEAAKLYEERVGHLIERDSKKGRKTLAAMYSLGHFYWEQGELDKAQDTFELELAGCEEAYGETDSETLGSMNNLASFWMEMDRYEQAQALLQKEVEARRAAKPADPKLPDALNDLARVLFEQGRSGEAEDLLDESLRANPSGEAEPDRDWVDTYKLRSRVLAGQGRLEEAVSVIELCMDAVDAHYGLVGREEYMLLIETRARLYRDWHQVQPDAGHDKAADRIDQYLDRLKGQGGSE